MFKRFTLGIVLFLIVMCFSVYVDAAPIIIKDVQDLSKYSQLVDDSGMLSLNSGSYLINSELDLYNAKSVSSLGINKKDVLLVIDQRGMQPLNILYTYLFAVVDGSVEIYGSNTINTSTNQDSPKSALITDYLVQYGGDISIRGGYNAFDNYGAYVLEYFEQTGGTLYTKSGPFDNCHGLVSPKMVAQSENSEIIAEGGQGTYSIGLVTGYLFQEGTSSLTASGGHAQFALGAQIDNIDMHNSSTIKTLGGNEYLSYGIYSENVSQNGNSLIKATGGAAHLSVGIVCQNFISLNDSSVLEAHGGSAKESYGVYTELLQAIDLTSIHSYAGPGDCAFGVDAVDFVLAGTSKYYSYGGSGTINSIGSHAGDSFGQIENSTIFIFGGSGESSFGLWVEETLSQSAASEAYVIGGVGKHSYGIYATRFIQENDAFLDIKSNSGENSYGMYAEEYVSLRDNGLVITHGGSGSTSLGIYTPLISMEDTSTLYAYAGNGTDSHGLYVNQFFLGEFATLFSSGSDSSDSYGSYIFDAMNISGILVLERNGTAASLYFAGLSDYVLNFKDGSLLRPILDLSRDLESLSGLIESDGIIIIDEHSLFFPIIKNSFNLEAGGSRTAKFIEVRDKSQKEIMIYGQFDVITDSLTIDYSIFKDETNQTYFLTCKRVKTPAQVFVEAKAAGVSIPDYIITLVSFFYNHIGSTEKVISLTFEESKFVQDFIKAFGESNMAFLLDRIDNSFSIEQAIEYVEDFMNNNWPNGRNDLITKLKHDVFKKLI